MHVKWLRENEVTKRIIVIVDLLVIVIVVIVVLILFTMFVLVIPLSSCKSPKSRVFMQFLTPFSVSSLISIGRRRYLVCQGGLEGGMFFVLNFGIAQSNFHHWTWREMLNCSHELLLWRERTDWDKQKPLLALNSLPLADAQLSRSLHRIPSRYHHAQRHLDRSAHSCYRHRW